jgi:DNA (cytosine-5)-methyltransferase 1
MAVRKLRAGSLFSGVEGLGLGLEQFGVDVIWHVENDRAAAQVLQHHFPNTPNFGDITKVDWEAVRRFSLGEVMPQEAPAIDLLIGGFP